jgi:AraC-like DNA-binding protein
MERRPMFHSRSIEETRDYFRCAGLGFDLLGGSREQLDVRVNGVSLPGSFLGYTQYGAPSVYVRMDPTTPLYWIKLPVRGHLEVLVRGDTVACDTLHGAVLSPTRENVLRIEAGGARLNLALRRDALARRLAALLGEPPQGLLDFAPALSLAEGHGRSLARFVRLAVVELERPNGVLADPMTVHAFEEFAITALLMSQPHNYTAALRHLERPLAPRDVKRAIEFMEANLELPIGLSEIVAASGVPGRTLLKHFQDARGTSPMRYLTSRRFEKTRVALQRATPEGNVTEIAQRWGFSHLGRFSVEYRRRFGEMPSETLRRSRTAIVRTGSALA